MSHNQHTHHPDDLDFAQLRGAFDAPIAPSPRFASQLKEELMAELTASDRIRPASIARSTRDKGQISRVQSLTATNWQGALITAAAVLAVLALSFASLRYVNQRFGDDNDTHLSGITHYPLASATPEGTPKATGVDESSEILGGFLGSDRSNSIGVVSPTLSSDVSTLQLDGAESASGYTTVVGDVYLVGPNDSVGNLRAFDLDTGELLWEFPQPITGRFASDGARLFGFIYDVVEPRYGLVAIDLINGQELWQFPDPSALNEQNVELGPIVANGIVYANDGPQTFYAVDAATGSELWNVTLENEIQLLATENGNSNALNMRPTFAVDHSHFYALIGGEYLTALDPRTGASAWTNQVSMLDGSGTQLTNFSTHNGQIFVVTQNVNTTVATPSPRERIVDYQHSNALVQAFDGSSGDQLWRADIPGFIASPVVVRDSLVIAGLDSITTLSLVDGQVLATIPHTESSDAFGVLRTSGDSAFFAFASGSDFVIARTDGKTIERQWTIPSGRDRANVFAISGLYAYNEGLILSVANSEPYYLAPASPTPTESDPLAGGFGGADRSFNLGAEIPELSIEAQLLVDSDPEKTIVHSQVIGDLILRAVVIDERPGEYLEAIDLRTGEVRWTFKNSVGRGISSDGKRVFVLTNATPGYDSLTALDLATGEVVWTVTSNQEHSFPGVNSGTVYADGIVYASFNLYSLIAVDSTSGEEIWNQKYVMQHPEHLELGILTGPSFAVQGDSLFTVWEGRIVEASDRKTGVILWSTDVFEPDEGLASQISIMADEHQVYVSGLNDSDETSVNSGEFSTIVAINRTTGEANWKSPESIWMIVVASTETSVIVNGGNQLHTIDKQTGAVSTDSYALAGDRPVAYTSTFDDSVVLTFDDMLIQLDSGYLTNVVQTWSLSDSSDAPVSTPAQSRSTTSNPSVPLRWNNQLVVSNSSGQVWLIPAAESADLIEDQVAATPETVVQANFGPVSLSLSETPELYPANLPTLESSISVELFGDILIRTSDENTSVEATDIVSGSQLWTIDLGVLSPFVSDGSSIYFAGTRESGEFGLVAVDLATGQEKWFVEDPSAGPAPKYARAPIVSDGVIYASDGASTYLAVNVSTGSLLWNTDVVTALEDGIRPGYGAFAVGDGHVYVASTIGMLVALESASGKVSWSTQYSTLTESSWIESDVVVSEGGVYVASTAWLFDPATPEIERIFSSGESYASAFNTASGTMLWQSQLNTATSSAEIVNDVLLVTSTDMFEPVDLATGEVFVSIKYTNILQTFGDTQISGNRAFAVGLVGDDLAILEIDGHKIVNSWRLSSVAEGLDHISAKVFSWEDGLLVLAPDGKFYRIAPAGGSASQATPLPTEATVQQPAESTLGDEVQPEETPGPSGGDNLIEPTETIEPTAETAGLNMETEIPKLTQSG